MDRLRSWLDSWSVNESEPRAIDVIRAGILFIGLMAALYGFVLVAGAMSGAL